jgi:hypothetical protein
MPCKDITDHLRIRLDADDRITRYALRKLSCGGAVGNQSLIIDWLENKSAEEVIASSPDVILDSHEITDEIDEYLFLKHFLAVKAGLSIMLGKDSGGIEDYCQIEAIRHGPNGTELLAHISVEGMTAEIQACGRCGRN